MVFHPRSAYAEVPYPPLAVESSCLSAPVPKDLECKRVAISAQTLSANRHGSACASCGAPVAAIGGCAPATDRIYRRFP
jgi:hypothetical protein